MQRIVLLVALVLGMSAVSSASACQVEGRLIARRPVVAVATAPVRLVLALRNRALRDGALCRTRTVRVERRGFWRPLGRRVVIERSIVVRR